MTEDMYKAIEEVKKGLPLLFREDCPHKLECFSVNFKAEDRKYECSNCVETDEHSFPDCECK